MRYVRQSQEDPQGSGSTPDTSSTQETGNKTIDTLRIAFVPSREPDEIITATEPLKQMLTDELAKLGYDVGEVDITVGTSYEAVGEALAAGTADAAVLDLTLANAMIGAGTDYASLKIVDELNAEEYGVAFRKGSDAAAAVDAAFDELKADGTMQALADKYDLALAE